jgi:hypothetical protein
MSRKKEDRSRLVRQRVCARLCQSRLSAGSIICHYANNLSGDRTSLATWLPNRSLRPRLCPQCEIGPSHSAFQWSYRTRLKSKILIDNSDTREQRRTGRWRREPDSNHESGWPYPFENSNEFSKLRTRDLCRAQTSCGAVRPPIGALLSGPNERDRFRLRPAPRPS